MPRSTNASRLMPAPLVKRAIEPRVRASDAERAAQGRAQIAAGQYVDGDDLEAFLDGLKIPAAKA